MKIEGKIVDCISAFYWLVELDGLDSVLGLDVYLRWQREKRVGVTFKDFGSNLSIVQQNAITNTIKRGVVPERHRPIPQPRRNVLFPFFRRALKIA